MYIITVLLLLVIAKINFTSGGVCFFYSHFKTDFPLKTVEIEQINKKSPVWDKFDVIDTKATCKRCKRTVKLSRSSKAVSRLIQHLNYCP